MAPVEDVSFLLNDVFQIDNYNNLPGFADAWLNMREAILGEAAKLSEGYFDRSITLATLKAAPAMTMAV